MRFLYCAIGMLLLLPAFGKQEIDDFNFPYTDSSTLEKAGLRGPVKTMRSYLQKGVRLVEELTFDRNGRLIQEIYYHSNSREPLWTHNFEYDEKGQMIKATSVSQFVKATGAVCVIAYDGQGHKISETFLKEDGSIFYKRLFTYDKHGRLLTISYAGHDAKAGKEAISLSEERRYDAKGNEIFRQYSSETTMTVTYRYYPDGKTQRQEMDYGKGSYGAKKFSPQGWLVEELYVPLVTPEYRTGEFLHERYAYTVAGNLKEETGYDEEDRLISRIEYEYNADGQEIERRYLSVLPNEEKLTLWQKRLYSYNAQGWKMEETIAMYDKDGRSHGGTTNCWTYDAYGNAIDNPIPYASMGIWLAYREFTYYE